MRQIPELWIRPAAIDQSSFGCVVCKERVPHTPGRWAGWASKRYGPDSQWEPYGPVCIPCILSGGVHDRWAQAHRYELCYLTTDERLGDAVEIDAVLEVVYDAAGAVEARARGEGFSLNRPTWRKLVKNRKARRRIGVPTPS